MIEAFFYTKMPLSLNMKKRVELALAHPVPARFLCRQRFLSAVCSAQIARAECVSFLPSTGVFSGVSAALPAWCG
jgi:hypothetical protein